MSLIIMSGKNLPWGKGEGEELSGEDAKEEGGGEGAQSCISNFLLCGDW